MALNCLFRQHLFALIGSGCVGTQIPIIICKNQCGPKLARLNPSPMVYERDGCSRRFFPNVEMGHVFSFWEIGDKKFEEIKINPPEDKDTGDVTGCLLAKSSFSSDYQDRYVFFEMAVMNDRIGWSLWADSYEKRSITASPTIGWEYKLFLLQREKGDAWKVQGGYHWKDNSFPEGNDEIHIDLPGQPRWVSRKMEDVSQTKSQIFQYSAIWKQDKEKNKEIFEPIRVWSKNEEKSDLFGKKGNFSEGEVGKGYTQVSYFYKKERNSWGVHVQREEGVKRLAQVDIGGVLDNWYQPFKGKHGSWIPFSKYCGDRRNSGQEAYVLGCKIVAI